MNPINFSTSKTNSVNHKYGTTSEASIKPRAALLQNQAGDVVELSSKAMEALKNLHQTSVSNRASESKRPSPLDKLSEAGIITKDQQAAVENALEKSKKNQITSIGTYTNRYTKPMDKLVAAGTITVDQKKAIQNAFRGDKQARLSDIKISNYVRDAANIPETDTHAAASKTEMTLDSQMDILDGNNSETPINKLLQAGIMTPDEKTSIENLFSGSNI